jgi:hypothetical protein
VPARIAAVVAKISARFMGGDKALFQMIVNGPVYRAIGFGARG